MTVQVRGRIAYLGPAGTFGQEVTEKHFSAQTVRTYGIGCSDNGSVVRWVSNGEARWGVVPLENSKEGPVGPVIAALHQAWGDGQRVYPCGTLVLPVAHNLIGLAGTDLGQIKTVRTHPQAWGQCQKAVREHLGSPLFVPTTSTAEAVRLVVEKGDRSVVAIASERAATEYGGKILLEAIQDQLDNRTRFLILSNEGDHEVTGEDQTLILVSCAKDQPGSLVSVLEPLRDEGLNANLIVSVQVDLGQYYFCLGFDGHRQEPKVARALEKMRQCSDWLYVLGSYPKER